MSRLRHLRDHVLSVLVGSSVPVWLTLLLVVVGAVGTYMLAPELNAKFERERVRQDFIIDNMKNLAAETGEVVDLAVGAIGLPQDQFQERDAEFNSRVSKLQFRVQQLRLLIPEQDRLLDGYQSELSDVQESLTNQLSPDEQVEFANELKQLSTSAILVHDALLRESQLR